MLNATDKESAAVCPEWLALPPALQDVLLKGWLDKRRQQASSDAAVKSGVTLDMKGSGSGSSSSSGVLQGSACFAAADALADGMNGEPLLLSHLSAQRSLLQQQRKQQQQVAAILQRGRNQQQQQQQGEQQPLVLPRGCVAGVSEAMAALLAQLRSTGLLP
jgi:hypothetical protein